MPGLMAMRKYFGVSRSLTGARISGPLPISIQTAVSIETLTAQRSEGRWSSCKIVSIQDNAAWAVAVLSVPVFKIDGKTYGQYWTICATTHDLNDGETANLSFVYGGNTSEINELGALTKDRPELLDAPKIRRRRGHVQSKEAAHRPISCVVLKGFGSLYRSFRRNQQLYASADATVKGGLYPSPANEADESVIKSKFDNRFGCRVSLIISIRRGTNTLIAGKIAIECCFGDAGRDAVNTLAGAGARFVVSKNFPICTRQAAMERNEVVRLDEAAHRGNIIVTKSGVKDALSTEYKMKLPDIASKCNSGHCVNEEQVKNLQNFVEQKSKIRLTKSTFLKTLELSRYLRNVWPFWAKLRTVQVL